MEHQQFTSVYITTEYDMFTTIDGNRMVNQMHVKKLMDSMTAKQLITPIIVNEKYEIIDGQHRYNANKNLELPVYYVICEGYGLADVHRLNERSNTWKPKDFLDGYSTFALKDPEFQNYITLKKFIEDYNLTPNLGVFLTKGDEMGEADAMDKFKNGYLKIDNLDSAEMFMYQLEDFHSYFAEYYKTTSFLKAFRIFSESRKYNHDNMVKKLTYMGGDLQARSNIAQYLEVLSQIYNTRLGDKQRIHFKGEKELVLS